MSLVNVRCINCNDLFEVTKEATGAKSVGFVSEGDVETSKVEVHVCFCAKPKVGELCPRCACAALRVILHNTENDLPSLIKGEHLTKGFQ